MTPGKWAAVAVLAAVILVCGYFLARRSILPEGPTMPEAYAKQPVEVVDKDTLEVITLTRLEVERLPRSEDNSLKNPKTGAFNLRLGMKCLRCDKTIPTPLPAEIGGKPTNADTKCPYCRAEMRP